MSAGPRFIPRAAVDERINKVRLHVWQGESLGAHTHDRCLCAGVSWARPPVSLGLLWGGSASAVFSAARFRFPFESLSYTIYEYGIGALVLGRYVDAANALL